MPASLEHLLAGRRAAELLRPEELPQYYLGCIAPDAPNLDGFASKEVRWSAHLRRPEPEEWIRHALKWLMKEGKPSSLRLGYAVHVVGDAVWDAHFEKKLQKAVDAAALSREERFRCRWDEHYRFEQEQLQADWWLQEVRWSAHLRRPEPEEWIRHALKWLMKEGKPSSLRLGYAVHVVGDAVWDAHFEKKLQKAVDAAALSREERFRCRWDEHYRFEQEQLQADWWLQEVRPLLAQAVPQAINGLPETLIGRFRDDLISSYAPAPEGKTVGFVTAERVAAFGQQLCEALQPLLKQLG